MTDPVGEDAPATDEGRGADAAALCEPGCAAGLDCEDALCHDPKKGTCGWTVPGHEDAGEMCRIPAGTLHLGCNPGQETCPSQCEDHCPACPVNVGTRVPVTLTGDVFLDRFEVTNALYAAYLADHPEVGTPYCTDEDELWEGDLGVPEWLGDHPVVCVTALEAEAYCAWAGRSLPTEAVWEIGARAGELDAYPWGPCFDAAAAQCLYEYPDAPGSHNPDLYHCTDSYLPSKPCQEDSGTDRCLETAPVSIGGAPSRPAGPFGLVHMAGNAAEWVADGYKDGHGYACLEGGCDQATAMVPAAKKRVVKGGSWQDDWQGIAGWVREELPEGTRTRRIGFRCARIPEGP